MWRILCVDDDGDSREILEIILQNADPHYNIETVSSAKDAMTSISARPSDLYIIDYWMPDIDGAELCRWIRRTGSVTPILIFSAAAYRSDRDKLIKAGADEYLPKPTGIRDIEATVARLLKASMVFRSADRN